MSALKKALTAIAEGYPVKVHDDRYICVENPDYRPDNGADPNLLIDVTEVPQVSEANGLHSPAPVQGEAFAAALKAAEQAYFKHERDNGAFEAGVKAAIETYLAALSSPLQGREGYVLVPRKLTRETGDAMIAAMWPSGEVIHPDEFAGPEEMLSAGHDALIAASPSAPEEWQDKGDRADALARILNLSVKLERDESASIEHYIQAFCDIKTIAAAALSEASASERSSFPAAKGDEQ